MKKFITKLVLAAVFMMNAPNVNSQNHCVLKNDKGSQRVISYSDNMMACQPNDQVVSLVTKPVVKPQVKGLTPTHTLNVYPPTEDIWTDIWVSDGVDLIAYLLVGDFLSIELEEGTYYIASTGWKEVEGDFYNCVWTFDNLELNENTDVYVDFDDCVLNLNLDFEDENGSSFNGMDFYDVSYDADMYWMNGIVTFKNSVSSSSFSEQVPLLLYNGFDEHSNLILSVSLEPGYQKSYSFICPKIIGMHESPTFTITAEELNVVQEQFTVSTKNSPCYYHTDTKDIINEQGGLVLSVLFSLNLIFNPDQPYTIITNAKVEDPTSFPKRLLLPSIYEWYDSNNLDWPIYNDRIGTVLYFDGDGNVIREASPFFRDGPNLASWPNCFPETPMKTINPTNKLTFFGERTPLATYYPAAFNANNSPSGQNFFYGGFFFSGEHSCERTCDYDSFIYVYVGEEEVYNDSIYKFNATYKNYNTAFVLDEPNTIVVEVVNDRLFANNVPKRNSTHAIFDLQKDDAMPPTMTFLRVLDGNGDENIWLDNLSQSTLVFGCGDFTYHQGGYSYDRLEYNAKPEIEVYFSIDLNEWEPLVFEEEESLFHIDYGNVFIADLGQLENRFLNNWVNLQFILIDEVGNIHMQNMSNVFYAGEMVSVNEHTANGLQHTVYPNPFNGEVRITVAQAVNGAANIMVYNVLGEQVYSKSENCTETQDFTIDGSAWKPGVYFYSINTEDGVLQGKIVKE